MKILLTGSSGQLGRRLISSKPKHVTLITPSSKELDLRDNDSCFEYVKNLRPDWIINSAAFTAVDNAESQKQDAYKINALAPKSLAKALKYTGGKIIQISTDYVFDGKNNVPYLTSQKKNPISFYGKSKADGEEAIEKELGYTKNYYILRTSWLISDIGNNFVLKMLNLFSKGKEISLVADQIGSPTSTSSLVEAVWQIIELDESLRNNHKNLNNIFHWTDRGITSWYELGLETLNISKKIGLINKEVNLIPIKTSQYRTEALRPLYSVLDCKLSKFLLNIEQKNWKETLEEILMNIDCGRIKVK